MIFSRTRNALVALVLGAGCTTQVGHFDGDDPGAHGADAGGGHEDAYQMELDRLLRSTVRNRLEDNSPYINTPSEELFAKEDLYEPYEVYLNGRTNGYDSDTDIPPGFFPNNGAATWRAECEVSHFSYDDPIVFPGQPGAAHLHMFFGNTHANAYSTYDSLMNSGGSTCNGGELNRTGYWVPAMFDGRGNVVVPSRAKFYYKTESQVGVGKVVEFPENLQIVEGTRNNINDNLDLATFRCNSVYNGAKSTPSSNIPACESDPNGQPGTVEMMIYFNHCWNGDEATAGDWKRNQDLNLVAPENYWHSSVCPPGYELLPAIVYHIFYDIRPGEDTSQWFLSSDVDRATGVPAAGGTHAHADWFGAWNKELNREFLDKCNNVDDAECAFGMLGDYRKTPNPKALRLHKDWMTGRNSPHARIPVEQIYREMCADDAVPTEHGSAAAAYCRSPGDGAHDH